ncbi:MAG TPA: 50S ribosomal protein L15 [Armatimonadetes bacterium]|nr:50S ribosomal protein L15 [Armatimonadota bacterium]
MKLHELKPAPGSRKKRKRVGRGIAAGQGKTCGRGTKGERARENIRPGFEGGQTPLHRRVPKRRGLSRSSRPVGPFRKEFAIVNVRDLNRFAGGELITEERLLAAGLIRRCKDGVRILGEGELTVPLRVQAQHFSASAREKIEAAGGKAEVVSR